jgi:hypothetical protein
MSCWRSSLVLACTLISGCALRTANRPLTPPAPASTGHSQAYTYSSPRNTVPSARQPDVAQRPVTQSPHVALLSPRMQGFNRAIPTSRNPGASAPKADTTTAQPPPAQTVADDQTIIAQPPGLETSGQISTQQVVAANLFPVEGPNYAGPIAAVIILVTLIYYALYKIAGPNGQVAKTNPLAGGNGFKGQYQPPARDSTGGSKPEGTQTAGKIRMEGIEGAEESHNTELDCSDRQRRILRGIRSRIKRTLKL